MKPLIDKQNNKATLRKGGGKCAPLLNNCFDAIKFDTRAFAVSENDIRTLCRFFNLGKLIAYEVERDIVVSHSNHIVIVESTSGHFVLKYSYKQAYRAVHRGLLLNVFLQKHKFNTPQIHASSTGQPIFNGKSHLITCFSFIPGKPLYLIDHLQKIDILIVNQTIADLNRLLAIASRSRKIKVILGKEKLFTFSQYLLCLCTEINESRGTNLQNMFNDWIKDAHQNYHACLKQFKQQTIHSNISLSNILLSGKRAYCLDLDHIRNDFQLNDLANFAASCILLQAKPSILKEFTVQFFRFGKISPGKIKILTFFTKLHLIKEYLKTIKKESNLSAYHKKNQLVKNYRKALIGYKQVIESSLTTLKNEPAALFSYE